MTCLFNVFNKLGYMLFILLLGVCSIPVNSEICLMQNLTDQVKNACKDNGFQPLEDRCLKNDTVVGLDFHDCNITSFNAPLFINSSESIIILGLLNNPLTDCQAKDFEGLTNLEVLFLPASCKCPGKWNNETEFDNTTFYCEGQVDPCVNVSCTDNGHCIHKGPEYAHCECLPGYYGYRCLRKGTFPLAVFLPTVIIPTVVISALLWYTQRRNIKKD